MLVFTCILTLQRRKQFCAHSALVLYDQTHIAATTLVWMAVILIEIESVIECGPLPPTSTSHPPDIIHVICVPRPSLFFVLFQIKERKWGRPGNEAN